MRTADPAIQKAMQDLMQEYLPIAEMLRRALPPPDLIVGHEYLQRWWLARIEKEHDLTKYGPIPGHTRVTTDYNVYLHRVTGSDDDRAPHDHPWPNASLILEGKYLEHTPMGDFYRRPGDIVYRQAEDLHWLELIEGPAWSLFITGKKIRQWGFQCPDGRWIPSKQFDPKGCGE